MTKSGKKAQESQKAVSKASKAVTKARAAQNGKGVSPLVTLTNGIVLRCSQVPPLLLDYVGQQVPEPMPPQVKIVVDGQPDRMEENPDDPDYEEALTAWQRQTNLTAINAMLLAGTKVESVPEGIFKPEDDGWLSTLEALGAVPKMESDTERYLYWLRLDALPSTKDISMVTATVGTGVSISEEAVAEAAASFPSSKVGSVDSADSSEEGS